MTVRAAAMRPCVNCGVALLALKKEPRPAHLACPVLPSFLVNERYVIYARDQHHALEKFWTFYATQEVFEEHADDPPEKIERFGSWKPWRTGDLT